MLQPDVSKQGASIENVVRNEIVYAAIAKKCSTLDNFSKTPRMISLNTVPLRCTCARNSMYARFEQLHSIPRSSQIRIMWAFLHHMGRIQLCAVIHYERAYYRIRRKSLNMFAFGTKPFGYTFVHFLVIGQVALETAFINTIRLLREITSAADIPPAYVDIRENQPHCVLYQ